MGIVAVVACTTLVLILISLVMIKGFYSHMKYSLLQSTILGLLISAPILLLGVFKILEYLVDLLFKIVFILGGTDSSEVRGKIVEHFIKNNNSQGRG